MAVLAVKQITRAGVAPGGAAAAAAGDSFPNNGKTFLRAVNANVGATRTLTFASQLPAGAIPQGAEAADLDVVVAADSEAWIGPFDQASWNDENGRVVVTYSSEADLTVEAVSL